MIDASTDQKETRRLRLRTATKDDRPAIRKFLRAHGLRTSGIGLKKHPERFLIALDAADAIIGVTSLSLHDDGALIGSLVVSRGWRKINLGRMLLDRLYERMAAAALRDVFVVTTTAEAYFLKLGYAEIGAELVPAGVGAARVFSSDALQHAIVLHRSVPAPEA